MSASPSLLIVEDDPTIARALRRELERRGLSCTLVSKLAAALALKDHYRVAIVDIHLPDGNGLDAYERLLESKCVERGIFFSATQDVAEQERAKKLGTFIPKSRGVPYAVEEAARALGAKLAPESGFRRSSPELELELDMLPARGKKSL